MKHLSRTMLIALATLFALNTHADDYTYIDYAVGTVDSENTSSRGEYSAFSSFFEMRNQFFISFDTTNYTNTNQYDYDITALGIGSFTASGDLTDIYTAAQLVRADLGYQENTGFRAILGLRTNLSNHFELAVKAQYEDVYQTTSKTYAVELRHYLTTRFSVGASYDIENIDDLEIETIYGSLRLNF